MTVYDNSSGAAIGQLVAVPFVVVLAASWIGRGGSTLEQLGASPGPLVLWNAALAVGVPALGLAVWPVSRRFVTRRVKRVGPTPRIAADRLREEFRDRARTGPSDGVSGDSRFRVAADEGMVSVDQVVAQGLRSPNTSQIYRLNLTTHVLPAIGELRLRELTVPRLDRFVQTVQLRSGSATAKIARTVVDLKAGTVSIDHTLVRIKGVGLVRKGTKSRAGERTLLLPGYALAMLRLRKLKAGGRGPVFPDSEGGWRDPSNTSRDLRNARGSAEFAWVTSHVFRKAAATELDRAGLSEREIADQLGHAKVSMTQDRYVGRRAVRNAAAEALDRAHREAEGRRENQGSGT